MPGNNAHQFSFRTIDGKPMPLSDYAGKAVLVVNTASACGQTPQYADLEALHEQYADHGLVVIGVPCNDFGEQEPGTESEIASFCQISYGVTFPMASKEKVRGDDAHPFYRWARETLGAENAPQWNFHKYIVGPDGGLRAALSTAELVTDEAAQNTIRDSLPG